MTHDYFDEWLSGGFPSGLPHQSRLSVAANAACCMVRDSVPMPAWQPCPTCTALTTYPSGECDCCTGDIRPVCRICFKPAPDRDWSEADTAGNHRLEAGEHRGKICPGSALAVTVLN